MPDFTSIRQLKRILSTEGFKTSFGEIFYILRQPPASLRLCLLCGRTIPCGVKKWSRAYLLKCRDVYTYFYVKLLLISVSLNCFRCVNIYINLTVCIFLPDATQMFGTAMRQVETAVIQPIFPLKFVELAASRWRINILTISTYQHLLPVPKDFKWLFFRAASTPHSRSHKR